MSIYLINIYLFILATVVAILEIQIEGKHGWAKNLPTWRPHSSKWYVKLYAKVMSGKELTGYHLTMFAAIFLFFNLPYVFGLPITLENYLKTVSFFLIFVVMRDFLWFVLNPHYPLSKFKKEHIWWHSKWLWVAPLDYYFGILASVLVLLPLAASNASILSWWLVNILMFGIETLFLVIFTTYVLKIDKWHKIDS